MAVVLYVYLIPIIIAIVAICVIAARKRKKTNTLANVTIQSHRKAKAQEPTVSEENALPYDTPKATPNFKAPKGNLVPIIICVAFIIICFGVILWSIL